MIKTLQSKMTQTEEKVSALQEFQLYVREGDALYIKQNFKYVLLIIHAFELYHYNMKIVIICLYLENCSKHY